MRGDHGPPGRERPGATPDTGPIQKSADTTTDKPIICHAGIVEWFRRHRAAERLPSLACGCCSDPLPCRCTRPPLSDRWVDAGADAARHVLANGCVPLLELEVLRALYRRGGDDRQLAQELYELAGGVVA